MQLPVTPAWRAEVGNHTASWPEPSCRHPAAAPQLPEFAIVRALSHYSEIVKIIYKTVLLLFRGAARGGGGMSRVMNLWLQHVLLYHR